MPNWDPNNRRSHFQRRLAADPGCFESILGIKGRTMTEAEYERTSQDAVTNAWAEFEAEKKDFNGGVGAYEPGRATYADDKLVIAVTDLPRNSFITCFHEHFDRTLDGHSDVMKMSIGQRQLRLRQRVYNDERGGIIRNVRRIRGV
jgi:hypothetical protein